MAGESKWECLKAARYIIEQRGEFDRNSALAYVKGDLRFAHTTLDNTEITIRGEVVLFAPQDGSIEKPIWKPGDWVQEVYKIKEGIEERNSRANEYCKGYAQGVWEGRRNLASEADAGGSPYQTGFARGVAAAKRLRYGTIAEEQSKEEIRYRVELLETTRNTKSFTEEESHIWNSLQASINADGEKSWHDLLLELYRHLGSYRELGRAKHEEGEAIDRVRAGIVTRLAKTSLAFTDTRMSGL